MDVKFKKPRPNRIFQHVVAEIQAAILDGRLKPGDQLPSEMKLKDMFDTSRGTIREALRVLEQKGLIDIKIGVSGGAVVREVDTRQITESLNLLVQARNVSFEQLVEFREAVEGIVAGLAAERAKPDNIRHLHELMAAADNLLQEGSKHWQELLKIDVKLHIAIAEVAGNPVFVAVLKMVHENILDSFEWFDLENSHVLEDNFQDMAQLIEAIENGQATEARSLARYHVRKFHDYLKKGMRIGHKLPG